MNMRIASTPPAIAPGIPEAPAPVKAIEARRKRPAASGEPARVSAGSLAILPEAVRLALQSEPEAADDRSGARQDA